jgi:hypothetical protein
LKKLDKVIRIHIKLVINVLIEMSRTFVRMPRKSNPEYVLSAYTEGQKMPEISARELQKQI